LIEESADLQRLVKSPVFSAEEQVKALDAILGKAEITVAAISSSSLQPSAGYLRSPT